MFYASFSKFQLTVLCTHGPLIIRFPNKESLYFGTMLISLTMTNSLENLISFTKRPISICHHFLVTKAIPPTQHPLYTNIPICTKKNPQKQKSKCFKIPRFIFNNKL